MGSIKEFRSATQGIAAVLLFGIAFAANADTIMKTMPAPAIKPTQDPNWRTLPPPPAVVVPAVTKPPVGGGVIQSNATTACVSNKTPRISSINGRSSGGIMFQPGDRLDISGCGFGYSGSSEHPTRIELVGLGRQISLVIDTWNDVRITAHLDTGISGIPDLDGVRLTVSPFGAPILSDVSYKFRAARVNVQVPLPTSMRAVFSETWGPKSSISVSSDGISTIVERNSEQNPNRIIYQGGCPKVPAQQGWLTDEFFFDGGIQSLLNQGFVLVNVSYMNQTQQGNTDDNTYQQVLVGGPGGATYDKPQGASPQDDIKVNYQGHSTYLKKTAFSSDGGKSFCTSRYAVSLWVNGPRGVKPFKL